MTKTHRVLAGAVGLSIVLAGAAPALAASRKQIDRDATAALNQLYASTPSAKVLGSKAVAILIFPRILKAGFIAGAQGGNGALRKGGKTVG